MSGQVDLATLAIAIDSTQARVAALELDKLTKAGEKTEKQMGTVAKASDSLKKEFSSTAKAMAALAPVLALGAYSAWIAKSIEATAAMKDLGIQAGITASQISKFELPARQAGVGLESVSQAMFMMTKALQEANDPASNAAAALKSIGINSQQLRGMRPDEIFILLAKSLDKYSDGVQKNAVMQELLGRAGFQTSKMMKEVAAASELASSVTDKQAEEADKLADTWEEVKHNVSLAGRAMAGDMLPSLQRITEAVKTAAKESGVLMAAWVAIGGIGAELIGLNKTAEENLKGTIKDLSSQIEKLQDVIEPTRRAMLLEGAVPAITAIETRFLALTDALRRAKDMATAIEGGFGDQVSRQAAQGRGTPASSPDYDAQRQRAAAEALKERTRLMEVYNGVVNKSSGLDADYTSKLLDLKKAKDLNIIGEKQYIAAVEAHIKAQPYLVAAEKARLEMIENMTKALEEQIKVQEEMAQVVDQYVGETRSFISDLEFEASLLGKTAEETQKLTMARRIDLEMKRAIAALPPLGDDATVSQAEAYARALESIAAAGAKAKGAIPGLVESTAQLRNELSFWDEISDRAAGFFTELVMNAENAVDIIKRSFKSLLAELIAFFSKKFILQVGASLLGGTAAGSALAGQAAQLGQGTVTGALGNMVSGIGSSIVGGVGNFLASGALGGTLQGIGGGLQVAGTMGMGSSFMAGMTNLIAGNGAMLTNIGMMLPGLGTAIAAIAMIAMAMQKPGGPKEEGGYYGAFSSTGQSLGSRALGAAQGYGEHAPNFWRTNAQGAAAQQWAESMAGSYYSTVARLGGTSQALNFGGGFVTDPRGTAPSFVHSLVTNAQGQTIAGYQNNQVGRSEADVQREMELQTMRILVEALKASDLPAEVAAVFSGLDVDTASMEQLTTALEKATEIADVLKGLSQLETIGLSMTLDTLRGFQREGESLTETFSRIGGQWSQFVNDFMPEADRLALAQTQVTEAFASLGMQVPATKDEFYDLVRGLDLTTESGRNTFSALMQVAPAFNQVASSAAQAAATLQAQAQQLASINLQASGVSANAANIQLLTGQFMANASWTQGMNWQSVAQALTTITQSDFANYSESQRELILAIRTAQLQQQQQNASAASAASPINSLGNAAAYAAEELARMQESLREWALGKMLGGASNLSPEEQIALALKEYEKVVATGDIGNFQGIADQLLELAREYYASGDQYQSIFERIMKDAEKLGGFDLGFGGNKADPAAPGRGDGIDRMRQDLGDRIERHRQETAMLRSQVADLIAAVKGSSLATVKATRESAQETTRMLIGIVEGTRR